MRVGRRSIHTAEELRELILNATTELIETEGLAGFSAREIARRIGYSPGTLYNVFDNLDDLILTIEGRLLDRLAASLQAVPDTDHPRQRLKNLAMAYLRFTQENPKLWNLLFEHHMQTGAAIPEWYTGKLNNLLAEVERELGRLMPDPNSGQAKRAARVLWAGVHGITSLSTADKLSTVTADAAGSLVEDLIDHYLGGLAED